MDLVQNRLDDGIKPFVQRGIQSQTRLKIDALVSSLWQPCPFDCVWQQKGTEDVVVGLHSKLQLAS